MPIDVKEVRVDTFTGGVNLPVKMRLVHLPTGVVVEGSGKSQSRLRRQLLVSLEKEIEKHNDLIRGAAER